MAGTTTSRLGLYKADPNDYANVEQDINANYDKIDAAIGPTVCTSGTRPVSPYIGQQIYETDTNRLLIWTDDNRWTSVTGRTFGPPLKFTTDKGCNTGAADATAGKILTFSNIVCDGVAELQFTASWWAVAQNFATANGQQGVFEIARYTAGDSAGRVQNLGHIGFWDVPLYSAGNPWGGNGGTFVVSAVPPAGTWDFVLRSFVTYGSNTYLIQADTSRPIRFAMSELPGAKYTA